MLTTSASGPPSLSDKLDVGFVPASLDTCLRLLNEWSAPS